MRLIEELCALLNAEGIDWVEDGRGGVWWRRHDGTAFVAVEVEGHGLTLKAMYVDPEEAVLMSNARDMRETYLRMVDSYERARGIEIEACSPEPDAEMAALEAECDALVAGFGRVRA